MAFPEIILLIGLIASRKEFSGLDPATPENVICYIYCWNTL